jgi:hypothetical protein
LIRYILITLIYISQLISEEERGLISSIFSSYRYKIEIGIDYPYLQSAKLQDGFIVEKHRIDFSNTLSALPSPYISLKSKAYLLPIQFIDLGTFLRSTFRYSNFSTQRAFISDGTIFNSEIDFGTSLNLISFDIEPTLFYQLKLSEIRFIALASIGAGLSFYTGNVREAIFPTYEDYIATEDKSIFQYGGDGSVIFIGEDEDLGVGLGVNLLYSFEFRVVYSDFNIHFLYRKPFVITMSEFLNIDEVLFGVGWSF